MYVYLEIYPLPDTWFASSFFHSVGPSRDSAPLRESASSFCGQFLSAPGCWVGYGHQFTAQKCTCCQPFLETPVPFLLPPSLPHPQVSLLYSLSSDSSARVSDAPSWVRGLQCPVNRTSSMAPAWISTEESEVHVGNK